MLLPLRRCLDIIIVGTRPITCWAGTYSTQQKVTLMLRLTVSGFVVTTEMEVWEEGELSHIGAYYMSYIHNWSAHGPLQGRCFYWETPRLVTWLGGEERGNNSNTKHRGTRMMMMNHHHYHHSTPTTTMSHYLWGGNREQQGQGWQGDNNNEGMAMVMRTVQEWHMRTTGRRWRQWCMVRKTNKGPKRHWCWCLLGCRYVFAFIFVFLFSFLFLFTNKDFRY